MPFMKLSIMAEFTLPLFDKRSWRTKSWWLILHLLLSLGYVAACSHIQLALRHRGVDVLARKDEEWWHMMNFFYYGIVIFIVIKKKEANRKIAT